jgi:hypothetical protein
VGAVNAQEKKMKTAHFEYKCRRCGKIEINPRLDVSDGNESKATIELINAMWNRQSTSPQSPRMMSLHTCDDSGCGVADLSGYHITDDSEGENK